MNSRGDSRRPPAAPLRRRLLGRLGGSLAGVALVASGHAGAQDVAGPQERAGLPSVPTTRVLAIGKLVAGVNPSARRDVMPAEVRETVALFLAGKIDQWFVLQDRPGVVFLMNVTDVKQAHDLLEALPLGREKMMEFELLPLGPLSPLSLLLAPAAGPLK